MDVQTEVMVQFLILYCMYGIHTHFTTTITSPEISFYWDKRLHRNKSTRLIWRGL